MSSLICNLISKGTTDFTWSDDNSLLSVTDNLTSQYGYDGRGLRDLEHDLHDTQPENNLVAILGFLIRGSGKIDDVMTLR